MKRLFHISLYFFIFLTSCEVCFLRILIHNVMNICCIGFVYINMRVFWQRLSTRVKKLTLPLHNFPVFQFFIETLNSFCNHWISYNRLCKVESFLNFQYYFEKTFSLSSLFISFFAQSAVAYVHNQPCLSINFEILKCTFHYNSSVNWIFSLSSTSVASFLLHLVIWMSG